MKIYTFTGDDGTTSLPGGRRIAKHSLKVEAYGSVDELISWIGLLRDQDENSGRKELLVYIQDQLMRCAAATAYDYSDERGKKVMPDPQCVKLLEDEIDKMESGLPVLDHFILPGGSTVVSYCQISRCVCRRAERAVLKLNETDSVPAIVYKFLNRLSDYLFVLARKIALSSDNEEIKWVP